MNELFLIWSKRPDWLDHAPCRGATALFFPERGDTHAAGDALAICRTCPVQAQCAELGRGERFGIWGGDSRNQRLARHRRPALERST